MTALVQLLFAADKGKQAATQMLALQVLSQIFTSYDKMFTILHPNVFLLHFSLKKSEDVQIIKCIKMPFIVFHRFPNPEYLFCSSQSCVPSEVTRAAFRDVPPATSNMSEHKKWLS
jgi:hypothetical protein